MASAAAWPSSSFLASPPSLALLAAKFSPSISIDSP
ncbi:uncharacterized protein METZ01_LOCUS430784 [marine metagenome]|uniref:Uncharacterized protein n=1 Tax=marine metagenome TaxID=408172 RepID=A0A382Y473_9ZZZZ